MSLEFGKQMLRPVEAVAAAIGNRTGLPTEVGPRPERSKETSLQVRPEQVTTEGSRGRSESAMRLTVALDCGLELAGRGGMASEGFRAEALGAHTKTVLAAGRPFTVTLEHAVGTPPKEPFVAEAGEYLPTETSGETVTVTCIPDGTPQDLPDTTVRVASESRGQGVFFETPAPESRDWEYSAEWLLTLRFEVPIERRALGSDGFLFGIDTS